MANVTFPFPFPEHLITLLPEMIVAVLAMVLLLIDVFITKGNKITAYLAILTTLLAAVATWSLQSSEVLVAFYGFFVFDQFVGNAGIGGNDKNPVIKAATLILTQEDVVQNRIRIRDRGAADFFDSVNILHIFRHNDSREMCRTLRMSADTAINLLL